MGIEASHSGDGSRTVQPELGNVKCSGQINRLAELGKGKRPLPQGTSAWRRRGVLGRIAVLGDALAFPGMRETKLAKRTPAWRQVDVRAVCQPPGAQACQKEMKKFLQAE